MLTALISVLLAAAQGEPAQSGPCVADRLAILALAPNDFDQNSSGGWRAVQSNPACVQVAGDLVRDYRKLHWGTLTVHQLHINYFHEGQLRAIGGNNRQAVPLLMAGVQPEGGDDIDFADYALGTIAFLQGDHGSLVAARERLSTLPEPEKYRRDRLEAEAKGENSFPWPWNLDVLDGLIACFGKPYAEAYDVRCRPKR